MVWDNKKETTMLPAQKHYTKKALYLDLLGTG